MVASINRGQLAFALCLSVILFICPWLYGCSAEDQGSTNTADVADMAETEPDTANVNGLSDSETKDVITTPIVRSHCLEVVANKDNKLQGAIITLNQFLAEDSSTEVPSYELDPQKRYIMVVEAIPPANLAEYRQQEDFNTSLKITSMLSVDAEFDDDSKITSATIEYLVGTKRDFPDQFVDEIAKVNTVSLLCDDYGHSYSLIYLCTMSGSEQDDGEIILDGGFVNVDESIKKFLNNNCSGSIKLDAESTVPGQNIYVVFEVIANGVAPEEEIVEENTSTDDVLADDFANDQ